MDDRDHDAQPESSRAGKDAKVAIPRIKGHDYQMPTITRTPRIRTDVVSKACSQCRKRKIKCSGHRPRCLHCQKHDADCHYDLERKDRLKGAIRRNQALGVLLNDISDQLDPESRRKVEDVLKDFDDDVPPRPTPISTAIAKSKRLRRASVDDDQDDQSISSVDGAEAHYTASVGSNEDLDFVQEDLLENKDASEIGYMGRNSHTQWLRALEVKIEQPESEASNMPYGPPGSSGEAFQQRAQALHERQERSGNAGYFTEFNFYLDHNNIDIDIGDPHTLPSAQTADKLFQYYKSAVHSPFRILDESFEAQLQTYFEKAQQGIMLNVSSQWKAVMNIVFAVGARYSHLIGATWQADDRDHLVYMWRAVHLLNHGGITALVSAPTQLLIQATGLLSLYYLTIGHVSRAWYMIGISLRHAQAAGLHLRHEDPKSPPSKRKTLARIWWGLYSIESVLTTILGRPRTVSSKDCTVPPPGSVAEGWANTGTEQDGHLGVQPDRSRAGSLSMASRSGSARRTEEPADKDSFEGAYVRLDLIMNSVLSGLYSARKSTVSWKQAQHQIAVLSDELDEWAARELSKGPYRAASPTNMRREELLLRLYYHSVRINITRPCLCKLDQRIKGRSEESMRFNQKVAEACINAALDMTSLLPGVPNPRWFYETGPWWSAVHTIMQGLTVLLLELSLGGIHLTMDRSHVIACVEKLLSWLQSMRSTDAVSEKAYNLVSKILKKQNGSDDFERHIPRPPMETQYHQQETGEQAPTMMDTQFHPYGDPSPQELESMLQNTSFDSSSLYSMPGTEGFYPNDPSGSAYLSDPNAGLFEFGQPQMPMFYNNPYETFDQWNWDPVAFAGQRQNQEQNQEQNQGQGQGQWPGQG